MPRLAQLLAQRRQQCRITRQLAFGTDDIGARDRTRREGNLHQLPVLAVLIENGLDCRNLALEQRDPQTLHDRVSTDHQIRGVESLLLIFRLCKLFLDGPRSSTRVIQGITDCWTERVVGERGQLLEGAEKLRAILLAAETRRHVDLGIQRARPGVCELVRLRQGRIGRHERAIARQCPLDHRVDLVGLEQMPPFAVQSRSQRDLLIEAR